MDAKASDYDFVLPESLIAQTGVMPRDHSRLMRVEPGTQPWQMSDYRFYELLNFLNKGDVIVSNNSAVIKARLTGRRVLSIEADGSPVLGGKIEFFLLEKLGARHWEGLFHASAKYRAGLRFQVDRGVGSEHLVPLMGELVRGSEGSPSGTVEALFTEDPLEAGVGEVPLPPYIGERSEGVEERYQTVYAKEAGSVATPTAGLHFTKELREKLVAKGVEWHEVTLHVGLGTFRPVKAEFLKDHVMHSERFSISEKTAAALNAAKMAKKRIIAVGTTTVRVLESALDESLQLRAGAGRTQVFFYPGSVDKIRWVDSLITNFHLPQSTLLMMVASLVGREKILAAYQAAIERGYRFYSFGDAMWVERQIPN